MKVNKSTRHSKITGDFAESLILYWLSKYGFECAQVDHTGIDLIAHNPHTNVLMGISVKARSRRTGKEGQYLRIGNGNFPKAQDACNIFGCVPYFALVIDEGNCVYAFIISMSHLLKLHPKQKTGCGWKMTPNWIKRYRLDQQIRMFEFEHKTST